LSERSTGRKATAARCHRQSCLAVHRHRRLRRRHLSRSTCLDGGAGGGASSGGAQIDGSRRSVCGAGGALQVGERSVGGRCWRAVRVCCCGADACCYGGERRRRWDPRHWRPPSMICLRRSAHYARAAGHSRARTHLSMLLERRVAEVEHDGRRAPSTPARTVTRAGGQGFACVSPPVGLTLRESGGFVRACRRTSLMSPDGHRCARPAL